MREMAGEKMRSYEMTEIVHRGLAECLTEAFVIAMDDCDGVFLSVDIDVCDPGHADMTAALGNRVVVEALSAIARRRRDDRDGTTWDPSQPLLDGR
jgi:agmatinase